MLFAFLVESFIKNKKTKIIEVVFLLKEITNQKWI